MPTAKKKDDRPALWDNPADAWAWSVWCWVHKNNWWRLRSSTLRPLGHPELDQGRASIFFRFDYLPLGTFAGDDLLIFFGDGYVSVEAILETDESQLSPFHGFDMNRTRPQNIAAFLRKTCRLVGSWSEPDRVPHGYRPYPDKLKLK